jgi:sarcosine oxidase subunit alpha/sarcosine oxidase subunit delta
LFKIECPNCGRRNVSEFRFGGQVQARPKDPSDEAAWVEYLYLRANPAGVQTEWWYHRMGCQRWFRLERDTRNNEAGQLAGHEN